MIRSTNLLERLIKEIKRSTKIRDHTFPTADSVLKVIYFVVERHEARLKDRKPKGFGQAEEEVRAMFGTPKRWGVWGTTARWKVTSRRYSITRRMGTSKTLESDDVRRRRAS